MLWVFWAFIFIFWIHSQNKSQTEECEEEYDSNSEDSCEEEYGSDSEDDDAVENEDELVQWQDIPFKTGWRRGTVIMVKYPPEVIEESDRTEDNYYIGKILRKTGSDWEVFFEQTGNTDIISPFEMDWYYDADIPMVEWPEPPKITLVNKTMKPFRYQVERQGNWRGAKTCRTVLQEMPIWSIRGTSYVYVGHLGVFECVSVSTEGMVDPVYGIPDDNYYIGKRKKGTTHFRDFKPLYIERPTFREFDVQKTTIEPIYEIPTRDELG